MPPRGKAFGESSFGIVALDAFSQALPSPLLQKRIWKKTFSPRGWDIINEEQTVEALVKRNTSELSNAERDALSISMTRKDWQRT